eukprot:7685290-Ditylum_brightwellii.AAC.1
MRITIYNGSCKLTREYCKQNSIAGVLRPFYIHFKLQLWKVQNKITKVLVRHIFVTITPVNISERKEAFAHMMENVLDLEDDSPMITAMGELEYDSIKDIINIAKEE